MDQHLTAFVERMDAVVAETSDPHAVADQARQHVTELVGHPEFLEQRHREPSPDRYQQHVVHVHPEGRYSLVSLVWRPGQATPVHDHVCWCVVGVLQGREAETRYHLYDHDGSTVLAVSGEAVYEAGDVCALVPPVEDIHKVANADSDGLTISMHVYGANIARLGSSVNHVFAQPVVETVHPGATPISWRAASPSNQQV